MNVNVNRSTNISIALTRDEAVKLFNALHQFMDAFNESDQYNFSQELASELELLL